ncbi:actin interacting protein-like protein [Leptomonas pyrrhocoris]|uniref:Actin interacting protein-like protein n=1 Tax=Leptomonas pyrrhocoris TaxID=157538 RepID=A0A0M9G7I5_LEPPY|nr:actin interacting protein-like protein [Leptomonas pyrrhocoris]XP_015662408.1 actin interacting protein-like protein [Leptomonas pyrrhocoris]XP_015662409.1 actin interacting protein-like protein [Leptomonas pyrrhocoris]KPA83968.1 actin interacting protein-like protein [Leptomonas pyrrhocoris]KPA83969.1 actin interacting protein-like protein [Leptomonas pyrrhocoris]KPA83970.1 actin interacting protein-like protein [Leptomonas pyrrhocoris]|eukprot:XP_015662407.1 actin interacting protein-like protein [Leptomonas pyrrhocoris]
MSLTPVERAAHYATRSSRFAKAGPKHLAYFKSVLDQPCSVTQRKGKMLTEKAATAPYNIDWMSQIQGDTPAVLLPTCTKQVSAILRYCQEEKLAVVPQGGNTGLVYGAEPVFDELVLSTQLMSAPPVVSKDTMSVEAEAGVILQQCQEACAKAGMLFPLTMGSKGSAMIGGTVSTNAGGIHFARYGSMHANVLGLEVVTAKGDVLNMMSTLRKDNAGYDLKHLFIGSEGTLGVVTRSAIRLYQQPRSKQTAMFRLSNFESVLALYHLAQEHLAECLSAFEVMDGESLTTSPANQVPYKRTDKNDAFRAGSDFTAAYFCVLVETNGSSETHDFEKLSEFVESAQTRLGDQLSGGGAYEPILSQSAAQTAQLWELREGVPVHLASSGRIYKYDVSFPIDKFYCIVEHTREIVYKKHKVNPAEVLVVGYGHFGDGNVHLNVIDLTRSHAAELDAALYPGVYEFCAAHGGSISAEHGVGMQKRDYVHLSRTPETIRLMQDVKRMMDPNGILNPYKVLPLDT